MNISPLNVGIDFVQQEVETQAADHLPGARLLPPDGQAVTNHLSLMFPPGRSEQLLEAFARPEVNDALSSPRHNQQVFEALLATLSHSPEGSAASLAYTLLQDYQGDLISLKANLKNLVQA